MEPAAKAGQAGGERVDTDVAWDVYEWDWPTRGYLRRDADASLDAGLTRPQVRQIREHGGWSLVSTRSFNGGSTMVDFWSRERA